MQTVNPADGRVSAQYEALSDDRLQQRLKAAANAFESWRQVPIADRSQALRRVGDVLKERQRELARLMTEEMGKPISQSLAEIDKCSLVCRHYAETAAASISPSEVRMPEKRSYIRFDPIGVVLAIMPWNFPFWQVFRQAAPAIAAGNTVLLKHAANVAGCGVRIEEVFHDAGLTDGIFTNLLIEHDQVASVLDHPRVQSVSLTGSERAASIVASAAASRIKKTILELGGSDPFIVLADADLDSVVEQAIAARTINNGQSCIAAKRFLVAKEIAAEFVGGLAKGMQHLVIGDPLDPKTQIGPLARKDLVDTLDDQVQRSIKSGARLVCGGTPLKRPGFFYPPTVLTEVLPGMAAFDEETFGPVAAVTEVPDNDAEIVKLANQSRFGLGASIWTGDTQRGERLAAQLDCGSVFINQIVQSDPRLPFGGVKLSGYGRELGEVGLREFTNIKTVCVG